MSELRRRSSGQRYDRGGFFGDALVMHVIEDWSPEAAAIGPWSVRCSCGWSSVGQFAGLDGVSDAIQSHFRFVSSCGELWSRVFFDAEVKRVAERLRAEAGGS